MRVTKAILQQRIDQLEQAIREMRYDALHDELQRAKADAVRYDQLAGRLLTIFERCAGEAQLRLTGAGAAAATNLENTKQDTMRLQRRDIR